MLTYEYFESDGFSLSVECYLPKAPSGKGLLFYYGGGWIEDNRHRFRRFARNLMMQGITVFLPQYRVYGRHQVYPAAGMKDAVAGMVFAESLYQKYGIRAEEVSWGGGSAGAQLVLTGALVYPFTEKIRIWPRKMILFNPVCCPHSLSDWIIEQTGREFDFHGLCPLCEKWGESINLPRILAMHGTMDEIAPIKDLESFALRYRTAGGSCEIRAYPGRGHGFHHPENSEEDYQDTLKAILDFL
ncbi:MAG: alpha/beta hydrolase [Lachnospiraceae bacterium]|nr:alpha/beta hydrolase [Lachnospiraceae bacterium]